MLAGAGVATGMIATGLIGDFAEDTALGAILTQPAAVSVPIAFGTMVAAVAALAAPERGRDDGRAARPGGRSAQLAVGPEHRLVEVDHRAGDHLARRR